MVSIVVGLERRVIAAHTGRDILNSHWEAQQNENCIPWAYMKPMYK